MLILFLASAALFSIASPASIADKFLDSLLSGPVQQQIASSGLDPAPLPPLSFPFTLPILPLSGRLDFENGVLHGLARIRRLAGCDGPALDGKDVRLECGLNFFGMDVVYDGKGKVGLLPSFPFQVTAYINETRVKSVMSGSPATLNGKLKLLELQKLGDIHVRLSGLGVFQPLYNAVDDMFKDKVREMVIDIILQKFPVPFGRAIAGMRLPGIVGG